MSQHPDTIDVEGLRYSIEPLGGERYGISIAAGDAASSPQDLACNSYHQALEVRHSMVLSHYRRLKKRRERRA